MKRIRRFVCSKCEKRVITTRRKPAPCQCDPKAQWLPVDLIGNEYEQRTNGWRRKQPKLKMTKKQKREKRRKYKEAIHAVDDR